MTGVTESIVTYAILSLLLASYVFSRVSLYIRLKNELLNTNMEN